MLSFLSWLQIQEDPLKVGIIHLKEQVRLAGKLPSLFYKLFKRTSLHVWLMVGGFSIPPEEAARGRGRQHPSLKEESVEELERGVRLVVGAGWLMVSGGCAPILCVSP